ncbi:MAG TPA: hypothetical protein VFW39_02370 [Sphingomicrobium sp.]|nr:hypothetical protein [Sphingomicrobium sp.]
MSNWSWIWPSVGPTPINQGLDSEMFDRVDYPYSETFVREAIQNSLDARLDPNEPVTIRFMFHEDKLGKRRRFLDGAVAHRSEAALSVPDEWDQEKIRWLTVEDSNTKGLLGDLDNRKGDFWGYWLNFGLSNKTGTGRGGRGIGRVTFLIASRTHTVLGITRRSNDKVVAASGMCVLKADQYNGDFKSTHSYLAAEEQGSIYNLHNSDEFHKGLEEAFKLAGYSDDEERFGLSLVIPYPYEELDEDRILAAAIDHFAPAILAGSLIVEVGIDRLDHDSIAQVAPCVTNSIKAQPIAEDVDRYLSLIEAGLEGGTCTIALEGLSKSALPNMRDCAEVVELRKALLDDQTVALRLTFPLRQNGHVKRVGLVATVAPTPYGKKPIDRLYREGMSLPDVRTRRQVDLDLVVLVEEVPLAQYLNLCEGKAHLDLLASKEVSAKLQDAGFEDGLKIRSLVKSLPDELRYLLTEESDEPDSTIFEAFFSIAEPEADRKKAKKKEKPEPDPTPDVEPEPYPPPNIAAVVVDTLEDGFRLRANPDYQGFPATMRAVVAYADGSGKPAWSELDFEFSDLDTASQDCTLEFADNRIVVQDWGPTSSVEVTGFDTRRELDTRIRTVSNATQD